MKLKKNAKFIPMKAKKKVKTKHKAAVDKDIFTLNYFKAMGPLSAAALESLSGMCCSSYQKKPPGTIADVTNPEFLSLVIENELARKLCSAAIAKVSSSLYSTIFVKKKKMRNTLF